MKSWIVVPLTMLAVSVGVGSGRVCAQKIYWTDVQQQQIRRADLGGSNVEILYSGLNLPYFFELDEAGCRIFWAENYNTLVHVSRMDGSGHIDTLDIGLTRIRDVELDFTNDLIYWSDRESHTIHRCHLDGTGSEILFDEDDGLIRPHGTALDVTSGQIYWVDTIAQSVNRGVSDGSSSVEVLYSGLVDPWDIELDIAEGKIYWVDRGGSAIYRGDLDGSEPREAILTSADGLDTPQGLGLDIAAGKMYWADSGHDHIRRANLDGSDIDTLITTGMTYPADLELGTADCTSVGVGEILPNGFELLGNAPNPFNPQTTITFALHTQQRAEIAVYDLTGRLLGVLADRSYGAGEHSIVWSGQDAMGRAVPSGTYVVRLETESGVETGKVMLVR